MYARLLVKDLMICKMFKLWYGGNKIPLLSHRIKELFLNRFSIDFAYGNSSLVKYRSIISFKFGEETSGERERLLFFLDIKDKSISGGSLLLLAIIIFCF